MHSARRITHAVSVGDIKMGAGHKVVVQSMTDTDTANINATVAQIKELALAGSEVVRVTVNNNDAAAAVPHIIEKLRHDNFLVPIVGDFHYNGHLLLRDHPACARMLDKYRINPGNVGFADKRDPQFSMIIEQAMLYEKPVRIGVNWGSLDQTLLAKLLDENQQQINPRSLEEVTRQALVDSALLSAQMAENLGMSKNKIILSCKTSRIMDLLAVYQYLADNSDYALHLGLTEAGMGMTGIVASAAALSPLLLNGIGDTIRVSITPTPGASRTEEVLVAKQILQSLGLRYFAPQVVSCPGCGRTTSSFFRELAEEIQNFTRVKIAEWKDLYPGVETLQIAVMGCIVNGPGESKHADIGISLPGTGESPVAPVFIDGVKAMTLRGDNIASEFKEIVEKYVTERFKR